MRQTFVILKKYVLNYEMPNWKPEKTEYLATLFRAGYTNSIAISQRHTEAVRNFPQSRSLVEAFWD